LFNRSTFQELIQVMLGLQGRTVGVLQQDSTVFFLNSLLTNKFTVKNVSINQHKLT